MKMCTILINLLSNSKVHLIILLLMKICVWAICMITSVQPQQTGGGTRVWELKIPDLFRSFPLVVLMQLLPVSQAKLLDIDSPSSTQVFTVQSNCLQQLQYIDLW